MIKHDLVVLGHIHSALLTPASPDVATHKIWTNYDAKKITEVTDKID